MLDASLQEQLEQLFRETGPAHHQAFIETDGEDPEWPLWYAGYLQQPIGDLLNNKFTKSELVYLLLTSENERQQKAPQSEWPEYYTKFFLEKLHKD